MLGTELRDRHKDGEEREWLEKSAGLTEDR